MEAVGKPKTKRKVSPLKKKERLVGLLFITPLCIKVLVFVFIFLIYSLYMSVTNWSILAGTTDFIGFQNYIDTIKDPIFWKSVGNTLYLMIGIPIGMVLALAIALALNQKIKGTTFFRVCVYLPTITSTIAIAVVWRFIYNSDYGVLNLIFKQLTGHEGPNWLGDPGMVKISLIIMSVWRSLGNTMVLILAALQNISQDYYEVVDIEGGNFWHKIRYVILPMLSSISFYLIITGIISGLQAFSDQFIMTGAGPEYSAITVVYYLWKKGFGEYNMGAACSVAWILSIAIFIVTLIQFKLSNKWVYED